MHLRKPRYTAVWQQQSAVAALSPFNSITAVLIPPQYCSATLCSATLNELQGSCTKAKLYLYCKQQQINIVNRICRERS